MNSLGDDTFSLPFFLCKMPSFRLQSLPRDNTQGRWGVQIHIYPLNKVLGLVLEIESKHM